MIWQPIETAPKDGILILAFCKRTGIQIVWPENYKGAFYGWVSEGSRANGGEHEHPTHWMPLPAKPEEETSDASS